MADRMTLTSRAGAPPPARHRAPWRKLYVQVLIAIAVGILLGHFFPRLGVAMKPFSDGFIWLIRAVVPLIIFATVAAGIAKMGDMRRVGTVGVRAIIYFEVVSTLALFIGLGVGNLLRPGAGLHIDPASLSVHAVAGYVAGAKSMTIVELLMRMIPHNMVGALAGGELLPVLVLGVLFGFALCHLGPRAERLTVLIDDFTHVLFGMVRIIMYVAPLAAFGAMAFTVGRFGFHALTSLGQLLLSVYVTSILFAVIGFGLIARLFGLRVLKIMRYFKDELLIAFSATSGEAMIPRAMAKLERMGCSQEVVGLVLPTGFSFNTDGTAIYMTMAVLFIAQATDIHLSFGQQLTMLFVMLFTTKGAAGVAGAGFVALAATMPALGILPVGGLALLLGVERFMSEIRAVTNLFSNIFATVVIARWMGELDDDRLQIVLDGEDETDPEDEIAEAPALAREMQG
ncbi:MAG TPA: C4-dicarboxylate transporter DctA [Stellaceae bacterium]|nr:C4-dicarboxylate transporter DctA [Stellaceae bacterium]